MNKSTVLTDKQGRIDWIDWAKGWTILFVVIYHAFKSVHDANVFARGEQQIGEWTIFLLATFIMPVFFALSGLVYKEVKNRDEYGKNMLKRIVSLAVPYIIFSAAYVFMQNLSPESSTHAVHPWSDLLGIFAHPISYLWYIYALVLIYILSGFLDLCKFNVQVQFGISLILFVAASLIEFPAFLHFMFTWAVTFNFGRLIKEHKTFSYNKSFIAALTIMLISWLIQIQFGGENWYDTNGLTFVTFISKMASIPVFFYIYSNFRENRIHNYFRKYGRDSLIIYLVHAPAVSVIRAVFVKAGIADYFLMIVGVTLLAWLISVIACYLTKKIAVIELIFYPTRYIRWLK